MIQMRIFKKFLIPGSAIIAGKAVEPVSDTEGKRLVKPSELPIYVDETHASLEATTEDDTACALETQIGHLRKELWVWVDKYNGYRSKVVEVYATGKVHYQEMLENLREESNYLPRYGAIGLGAVTGIVLGMRGGSFRKLTYGSVGGGAMAALCYPREAADYSHMAAHHAKKYAHVAYNFIYGVKPDYIRLPEPGKFLASADDAVTVSSGPVVGETPPLLVAAIGPDSLPTVALKRDQSKPEDRDMYSNRSN